MTGQQQTHRKSMIVVDEDAWSAQDICKGANSNILYNPWKSLSDLIFHISQK